MSSSLIIKSNIKTLEKAHLILNKLSNDLLSDSSIAPYYSSIGSHMRHILDFYSCIFNITNENKIDLTARPRNKAIENSCEEAKIYLNNIIETLKNFNCNSNKNIIVLDDLGLGTIEILTTIESILAQANSHTIHHFAIINYILNNLNITIEDPNFGFNYTTPKK
ncbi:hypothetical protein [Siansivirga zeaxanthinifaciens]|uniref:DinB family protein n=1 Tax=Siansivirga zeaxanthinifaciens CC-SAMT-1 TaxID=1454006 RepID=A0A0C5WHF0_9FLAO|nr:hypothetical protein [Siansivirga zeaxanthinifaciens]AJR04589.1 hypothetical protein AW14_14010 [Siansivirga zeaxanthinifaciens CC-SAMT-1]